MKLVMSEENMKAWVIKSEFGLDRLSLEKQEIPEVGVGQLLIKLQASSLNYRDIITVEGGYGKTVQAPLIPCSDGVGVVVKQGEATYLAEGTRVMPIFFPKWLSGEASPDVMPDALGGRYDGTLSEYMLVKDDSCVVPPEHLTDVEAASLPCAALTAWSALFEHHQIKKNDKLIIQGTGGVALFALQFAKAIGANVLITSSSNEKLARAKSLGADYGINYLEEPQWSKAVKQVWSDGADHVIELGGAATLEQSIRSVRIGGGISLIGVLSGTNTEKLSLPLILMRNIRIQGVTVGSKAAFERMNAFISTNKLQPVIDRVFNFSEAPEAFRYLKAAQHFGKVCIKV